MIQTDFQSVIPEDDSYLLVIILISLNINKILYEDYCNKNQ